MSLISLKIFQKENISNSFIFHHFLLEISSIKMYNTCIGVMNMVKSMTGYGTETFHLDGTTITVEIKTVNSRYLDFIPKVPRLLQEVELEIKKRIQSYFQRGRIEVYVSMTGEALSHKKIRVDWDLMDQYVEHLQEVKDRYQLSEDIPLSVIASEEALFTVHEEDESPESLHALLFTSIDNVCEAVIRNRKSEGENLIHDIMQRIRTIHETLTMIEGRQEIIAKHYRERIRERIEGHMEHNLEIDQTRIIQEVAILAERGDIQEELTRLFSHLEYFERVTGHTTPIGRKLDFITQEMHREVNTIGSKSVDTEISEAIVAMKSDIEKIKEQVQNIE